MDHGSASHDPHVSKEGSAACFLQLLRRFCQKDKGSAGADPRNNKGGSARLTMVLLAMIPKLVERVLLNVLLSITGFC